MQRLDNRASFEVGVKDNAIVLTVKPYNLRFQASIQQAIQLYEGLKAILEGLEKEMAK